MNILFIVLKLPFFQIYLAGGLWALLRCVGFGILICTANLEKDLQWCCLAPCFPSYSMLNESWSLEWGQNLSVELLANGSHVLPTRPLYHSLHLPI